MVSLSRPKTAGAAADVLWHLLRVADSLSGEGRFPESGSGSRLHRYFQKLVALGIFQKLWKLTLEEDDALKGIEWERQRIPGYRSRRWVVERTHSRWNRFRPLLIRCEKNLINYLAWLHFACACVTFHAASILG